MNVNLIFTFNDFFFPHVQYRGQTCSTEHYQLIQFNPEIPEAHVLRAR